MRKFLVLPAALIALLSLFTIAQGSSPDSAHIWFFGDCQNPYDSPDSIDSDSDSGGGYFLGGGCRGIGVFAGDWDNESIASAVSYEAMEEFGGYWEVDYLKAINIFGGPPQIGATYGCGPQDPYAVTPQTFGGGLWIAIFSVVPCEPVEVCMPPVETLIAVAYIDNDTEDGGYDPCVDVLIAKLVDMDGDRLPSIGDKVMTSQYPLGFDFGLDGFGSFSVTEHTLSAITYLQNDGVSGSAGGGGDEVFNFRRLVNAEEYSEILNGDTITAVQDASGDLEFPDVILADTGSPSAPSDPVEVSRGDTVDNAFIDVELYYMLPPE